MPGQSMPPGPLPAGDDLPAQGPQAAGSAGAGGIIAPPGAGAMVPPSPPGTLPGPAAASGPPWPRLVAADGDYRPPRLIRWPIVVGIVLLVGWIAAAVIVRAAPISPPGSAAASPASSAAGYLLTAGDAHFTATFPSKPQRTVQAAGTTSVIAYIAVLSDHAVAVTYVRLPAPGSFSLNGAINGAATSLPGGKVISRSSLTYHGQPAEDAVISVSGGSGRVRVVRFGSSGYIFVGFGNTAASFARDYQVLLDSFTPHR